MSMTLASDKSSSVDQARIRVTEVFFSLQGEGRETGLPTTFVRLTGCPLRCGYCDTEYAFQGGQWFELTDLISEVRKFPANRVTVTGGEPLAQKACLPFLSELCEAGFSVSLETSGALDICNVDPRVSRVMDIKTPASGEMDKNRIENVACLNPRDQVKFVICDRNDYEWACEQTRNHDLRARCEVLFSPCAGVLEPTQLAEWILSDGLDVRMQIQLHKFLWGDEQGR